MKDNISKIFGLQAFHIESATPLETEKGIEFKVRLKAGFIKCPVCGKGSRRKHDQRKEQTILWSISGGFRIILKGCKRRWKCNQCKKAFTEVWPTLKKWSRKSDQSKLQILELLKSHSFNHLESNYGITDRESRYLLSQVTMLPQWEEERRQKNIKLGIDEHSYRGRNLVITITNLTTPRLKAILTDDRQASLTNWISSIPEEIKAKISEVCIDMKPLFETVIKNLLPNAAIVIDKFHLIKDANSRIDEARLIEQEALGRRKLIPKWVFLKGKERLSEKEKALLKTLLTKYNNLYEFYWVKEKLRDMYQAKTKEEAANQLSSLIKNMECSDDAAIYQWAQTLRRWRYAILNYFNSKTTNAFTEGTHTKVKLIKRLSYGFRNVEVYVKKMLLAFIPFTFLLNNFPHVC